MTAAAHSRTTACLALRDQSGIEHLQVSCHPPAQSQLAQRPKLLSAVRLAFVRMSDPDLLFATRNSYYIGAYQAAVAEASDLEGLSTEVKVERDSYVCRSYVELGSCEVIHVA